VGNEAFQNVSIRLRGEKIKGERKKNQKLTLLSSGAGEV
jgi:hypothetical protein